MDDEEEGELEERGNRNYLQKKKYQIHLHHDSIEKVKEACTKHNYPLISEYDFKMDHTNHDLLLELKSST